MMSVVGRPRTATEIADGVRRGSYRAAEAVGTSRDLYRENLHLNAFLSTDWRRAEARAQAIDSARKPDRLAGVPVSVKDVVAVAGSPLTLGSSAFARNVARTTAPAVRRVQAAGAVVIGKTNCPDFAFGTVCSSSLGGETLNPRHPGWSPGGSSGGEAASVAAGITAIGIGTDYGGSLRWPAQCTGLLALRPTAGRVPGQGQAPGVGGDVTNELWPSPTSMQGSLQTIGALARNIDDLQLAFEILVGSPPRREMDGSALRVGWTTGRNLGPVADDIVATLHSTAATLGATGATRIEAALDGTTSAYNAVRDADPLWDHLLAITDIEDLVAPEALSAITASTHRGGAALARAWRDAIEVRHRALRVFEDIDVLMLPVAGAPACRPDGTSVINGVQVGGWALMAHCRAVTLLGSPSLSVPIGTSSEGLTISAQLVAAPGNDEYLFAVARSVLAAA